MAGSLTDTHRLSNGVEIPILGFGTWQTPDGDTARDCVKAALDAGYRHIDTAWVYGNEISVGEGIRASGVNRGDIFLTTKHWVTERGYEKTKAAIDVSLKNLGVDYLDLYLIHWPCVAKISPDWKEINASTWRGFEEAYRAGKIRALGVSNFEPLHLDALLETAEVAPCVNQIEFHPGYTQPENVKRCRELGIAVEAWSPLGCGCGSRRCTSCGDRGQIRQVRRTALYPVCSSERSDPAAEVRASGQDKGKHSGVRL